MLAPPTPTPPRDLDTPLPARPPHRRFPLRWRLATIAAALMLLGLALVPSLAQTPGARMLDSCPIPSQHDPQVIQTVFEVGQERGASGTAMRAAFATGWIESHMHNLPCGDRDSVGVFQQRPSQGWGTSEQLMDVRYATTQFFDHAAEVEANTGEIAAGELAQRVQRSAHPDRYDQADAKAQMLLHEARRLANDDPS